MSELYVYDTSTHLTTIRDEGVSFTQMAEAGGVGTSRIGIDDTAGTLEIVVQKNFLATQSSCSNATTFRGFVDDQDWGRDAGHDRAPHVGAGRGIGLSLVDGNAALGFRGITGDDRKRPAETVAERGAWLMASDYVSGLFIDNGRCDFPSDKGMDKSDYTDQHPGDVLADMALAAGGYNWHVPDYGDGFELVFRNDNTSTADSSTLRISNVAADVDSWHDTLGATKTFAPSVDARLSRKGGAVISKLSYQYAKGRVVEERAATATAFNGERFGTASNSNVKTEAKARETATAQLWQLSTPEDVITCTIQVPASAVNLLYQGWRVQVKFQHLGNTGGRDYDEWTWCRVLERTVTPINAEGAIYDMDLRLSPQEAGPPATGIIQSVFGRGYSGGLNLALPNPVTVGSVLVAAISTKLDEDPEAPNITADLPHIGGTGAWTRFNGATLTRAGTIGGGLSMYYKTATDTDQTAYISEQNPAVGIWELAGADPASATIQDESGGTSGPTYRIGSAGTVAAGEVALFVAAVNDGPPGVNEFDWVYGSSPYAWQTPNPNPGITSGWTLRYSKWNSDSWSREAFLPSSPWTVMADAEGDGSSLDAAIVPGETGHYWYGLYIVIPPI